MSKFTWIYHNGDYNERHGGKGREGKWGLT